MTSKDTAKKLISHWRAQRHLRVLPGLSTVEIDAFSNKNNLTIPVEFVEYLNLANGFNNESNESTLQSSDDEAFEFYALSEQRLINSRYFIFCEWTYGFIEYAICVDNSAGNGTVVQLIDKTRGYFLAKNFSDFVSLYISNSDHLYAPGVRVVSLKS